MSAKNVDHHNRWRNVTIAFRVSPEENESINMRVRLSGLTKQDYITKRCQERDVVVVGNPRVFKALKNELAAVLIRLQEIERSSEMDEAMHETIQVVAKTLDGMCNASH